MTKKEDPEDPKDRTSQEPKEPDQERPKHRPEGREHAVHREILERRMRGGPEPTPDAYARALEQWKNLPGSIVRPPTDVTAPRPKEPSEQADEEGSSPSNADAGEPESEEQEP